MTLEIPGYEVLRLLGRGGMAKVYLAVQEVFEREVALKVMSRALADDPNFNQRFFREAKIVSKLVHPNIVTVHDVGKHNDCFYLSMEYIDGPDLKHAVYNMSIREKICAINDIAKALDYASGKGYVHRDIKPENIMFHTSDGRAVLMDFGIARAAESDTAVTQTGTAIGTPHYMSPEQAKGKTVDHRSDIYSLGVVFFYCLAGHVPFDAESAVAIGIKHITEPTPLLPRCYEPLQPIVDKMMAKKVADRYQDAKELMADLASLDIEVLAHSIDFIADFQSEQTTGYAGSRVDYPEDEPFELEEGELSEYPSFDALSQEMERQSEHRPIFPVFVAGVFVIAVVTVFLYFKSPALFDPVVDRYESIRANLESSQLLEKVASKTQTQEGGTNEQAAANKVSSQQTAHQTTPQNEVSLPELPNTPLAAGKIKRETGSVPGNLEKNSSLSHASESVDEQLAKIKQKITFLENTTDSNRDPSAIVMAYRDALQVAPKDSGLKEGLDTLRREDLARLAALAAEKGQSRYLEQQLSAHTALYPETSNKQISVVESSAKTRKKVLTYVLEAQAYQRQNALTKPAGRNALDMYHQALALDPKNIDALKGKKQIAQSLAQGAENKLKAKRYTSALASANKALSIDKTNRKAQTVKNSASSQLDRAGQIDSLLKGAEAKLKKGELFLPSNRAAFHDYQSVLKLDPNNESAKQGIERVVDALSSKAWKLVGDEEFRQARDLMRASLNELGGDQRVQSLADALDEIISDKLAN
ncbi:MAG: protein kinase [Agarilytica sp.]